MRGARWSLVATLVAVLLAAFAAVSWADGREVFGDNELPTRLTGRQEVPPVDTQGSGRIELDFFQAASGNGFVCYQLQVTDLEGDVVAGHIHEAPRGVNGPIVIDLMPQIDSDNGYVEDCVTAPTSVISDVLDDPKGYYVNVHTEPYPDGEVRGQLHR